MAPSISIRESMRWPPLDAFELTRTVVLTSPENRFVDIRVLRSALRDYPPFEEGDVLPLKRLDWAFAGTSSSTVSEDTSEGRIAHAKWEHWIDSKFFDAESVNDEGDMYALTDGRTLEKGKGEHPGTGLLSDYEEVWMDEEILATPQAKVSSKIYGEEGGERSGEGLNKGEGEEVSAEDEQAGQASNSDEPDRNTSRNNDDPSSAAKTCTVLILHDDEHQARGMAIQLGQFCQAFLRTGEHLAVERWIWKESSGWTREVNMGDFLLPCGVMTGGAEKVPDVGGTVRYGDYVWTVVEKGEI